jgi:hypothetical protein
VGGKDIQVINSFNKFKKNIQKQIKKNTTLKMFNREIYKKEGINKKAKYNIEWILQEYINNPLLIDEKKFNLRVNFIHDFSNKKYYIYNNLQLYPVKNKYKKGDYQDKNIHDTGHTLEILNNLFIFPNEFNKIISKEKITNIMKQITEIFKGVSKVMKVQCYSESKNCFHLFGADIMITDEYKVKLIEVNEKPSSSIFNLNKIVHRLFENIVDKIVDKHFPPSIKVKELNNFIDVTP